MATEKGTRKRTEMNLRRKAKNRAFRIVNRDAGFWERENARLLNELARQNERLWLIVFVLSGALLCLGAWWLWR